MLIHDPPRQERIGRMPQQPAPMPFGDLQPATPTAFEAEGFPARFVEAFKNAAEASRCVVLSRPPGIAANGLIEAGYDLKGYFNKTKSCDWGPMAGFVCRQPQFNKKGAPQVTDNRAYIAKFEAEFKKRFPEWIKQWNAREDKTKYPPYVPPDGVTYPDLAYVQISITGARLDLLASTQEPPRKGLLALSDYQGGAGSRWRLAVATDKDGTVGAQFLLSETMRGDVSYFDVYTNRVAARDSAGNWLSIPLRVYDHLPSKTVTDVQATALRNLWASSAAPQALKDFVAQLVNADDDVFLPVESMINTYPPYSPSDQGHNWLNAMTGDYDLFGVWPRLQSAGMVTYADLIRTSDLFYSRRDSTNAATAVFRAIIEKPCAVAARHTARLILDVAPTPAEIEANAAIESDELGTINSAIALVAGLVNAFVADNKQVPNAVFHSDDGANPLFSDLDFPIAAFPPPAAYEPIPNAPKNQPDQDYVKSGYLLTDRDQFIKAIAGLLGSSSTPWNQFFVPLNLLCFNELIRAAKPSENAQSFNGWATTLLRLLLPPATDAQGQAVAPPIDFSQDTVLTATRAKLAAVVASHQDRQPAINGQDPQPGLRNSMQAAQDLAAVTWTDFGAPAAANPAQT